MKNYEEFQKSGQANFDTAVKNFGQVNNSVQAITSEVNGYTKKAIEDGTAAFEKLIGVKSVEQAMEVPTANAAKAVEDKVWRVSKLGEMLTNLAKDAAKPVETAFANKR